MEVVNEKWISGPAVSDPFFRSGQPVAGKFKDWMNFGDAKAFIEEHVLPILLTSVEMGTKELDFVVDAEEPIGWAAAVRAEELAPELLADICRLNAIEYAGVHWKVGGRRVAAWWFDPNRSPVAPLTRRISAHAVISKSKRPGRNWLVQLSLVPGAFASLSGTSLEELARGGIVFFHPETIGETTGETWTCAVVTRHWKEREYNQDTVAELSARVQGGFGDRVYQTRVPDTDCSDSAIVLSQQALTPDQAQQAWAMYIARGWNNPVLVQAKP